MYKIDWNSFKVKNENSNKAFEDLCYHMFCRKHKFSDGMRADFNQEGLETLPRKSNSGNLIVGFQSKFFEEGTDYGQIKKSIEKAIKKFENNLDEITIYLNSNAKPSSSKTAKDIEEIAKAKKISIQWYTKSQFEIELNQPSNLDLAQLYFGLGDEFNFIKSNISVQDSSFLQSSQLLDLPIIDLSNRKKCDIKLSEKVLLLTGNPGSGKSILVKKMFYDYSKMGQEFSVFEKNNFLPMLINLKDCYYDSLENIIRNRQNDYKVRKKSIKFIYILDGLDELSEIHTEITLQYVKLLSNLNNTRNILISCRKGSLNRLKIPEYFDVFKSYEINQLSIVDIENYFIHKNDLNKEKKLSNLKKKNKKLLDEINDIFLVKLLWDTIENIDENSTIIDIIELKIFSLLRNTEHKNNLESLNLLNPKENQILQLNEIISYRFSRKYQYRFRHNALTKIVEEKFNKADYDDVNKILNYNSGAFFDANQDSEYLNPTYIYQHRRYQEYFFAKRLKKKFERNMKIIRKNGVILNADFFDEIFIKYLEREYKKTNDIPALILLKSIQVYQKNGDNWYISDSDHFINNLTYQNSRTLEILLNDDVLDVKSSIHHTYSNAEKFHENNSVEFAQELVNEIKEKDWNFKEIEGYLFSKLIIKSTEKFAEFFINNFRDYYEKLSNDTYSLLEEQTQQEFALKACFRIGLKHRLNDLISLIAKLNEKEIIYFLDLLSETEFLPLFFANQELKELIKNKIKSFRKKPILSNLSIFFFKKLLNLTITSQQSSQILEAVSPLKGRIKSYSFIRFIKPFTLCYYTIGEQLFYENLRSNQSGFHSIDDIIKYSYLFQGYIEIIKEENSFQKLVTNYFSKFKNWYPSERKVVEALSGLWGYVFYQSKAHHTNYLQISRILTKDFDQFVFLEYLNKTDRQFFSEIISEADLVSFAKGLKKWEDDYPKYIDRCFLLSGMFSRINPKKSIYYIKEGFTNSYLRHGWRKDIFVSHFLNDAFGQILDKKWISKKEVSELSERLYHLNLRLYNITDQDHTRYGVSEFLEALSKNDTELAYKYFKKFRKLDLDWHVENIALTDILINNIKMNGKQYDFIQEKIKTYNVKSNHRGEIPTSYYQKVFSVEMEVLKSDLYDENVKKMAFENAHEIVQKVNGEFDYQKSILEDYYECYNNYCIINNTENLIGTNLNNSVSYIEVSEEEFSNRIDQATTKQKMISLYEYYQDSYKNKIQIKDKNVWKKWIDKTYALFGNVKLFTNLIKKLGFLLSGFDDSFNSKYLYIGVAYCIENISIKQEMLDCLIENSGYGGFYKMIYVYKELNDKKMALDLFDKFYDFCDFLVN